MALISQKDRYKEYLKMLKEDFVSVSVLERLNPDGTVAKKISNKDFIQEGSLSVNFNNGTRRVADVTLENSYNQYAVNPNDIWFGSQWRLKQGLVLPDGTDYLIPQGVFYVNDPNFELKPSTKIINIPLIDKWAYLDGTLFGNLEDTYLAKKNDNIYSLIQAVLKIDRGNGIPIDSTVPLLSNYFVNKKYHLNDETEVSAINVPFDTYIDADSKTYADLLLSFNDFLTGIIGYDNTGALKIEPSEYDINDGTKPILWEFNLKEKEFLGGTYTFKMNEVYNVVQIIGDVLNGVQAKAEAVNTNLFSPTSVYSALGRRVNRTVDTTYYNDEQCRDLANWKLKRMSILYNSISFESSPMYHLQENQIVKVSKPDGKGVLEPYLINGFTLPIAQTGEMTINATSVNDIIL